MVIAQFGHWDESIQDSFFDRTWRRQSFEIIYNDQQKVGFCSIIEESDKLRLMEFAIDLEEQGKGLGTSFLNCFKSKARELNKRAYLNVMKTNVKVKKLYEANGFEAFDENDFQYLLRERQ